MSSPESLRTAVVGCGLIGSRRAREAAAHPLTELVAVCDTELRAARTLAEQHGGHSFGEWAEALQSTRPDIAVIATPNHVSMPAAMAALEIGAHVLVEKPMGRNLAEAERMARAAESAGRTLKVGFNHRFHPAIQRAQRLSVEGVIGTPLFARCTYGHGGRSGYASDWRFDPEQSGGGELLDQGVHVLDLMRTALGKPCSVYAELANLFWKGKVEDNAFALLRYPEGQVGSFHTSWTRWKNRFSWEVHGEVGAVEVEGLGGSYGTETLRVHTRERAGDVPTVHEETFAGPDRSWQEEWREFVEAIHCDRRPAGDAREGLEVMRVLDALYRSAADGVPLRLGD